MDISKLDYPSCFSYFGGKSLAGDLVWSKFGFIERYIEPFFGSGSVFLKKKDPVKLEIVNDKDHYISNFWRTIKYSSKELLKDLEFNFPKIQVDLTVRHRWIIDNIEKHKEKIESDPFYHDVQIASFWIWGSNLWIGDGWGHKHSDQKPAFNHTIGMRSSKIVDLELYVKALADRFQDTIILNGDWMRCFAKGNYINGNNNPITGVFLDPPYSKHLLQESCSTLGTYKYHDDDINKTVFDWAIENGENYNFRIAVCGYDGEYPFPDTWEKGTWHYPGGYSNMGKNKDKKRQEVIWFSPYCNKKESLGLFDFMDQQDQEDQNTDDSANQELNQEIDFYQEVETLNE